MLTTPFSMVLLLLLALLVAPATAAPCRVEVVEKGTGWPVPLVELKTTHSQRFVTDNAGVIALDSPELLGRETWFDVQGHGYEVPKDGFGMQGVRFTPEEGKTHKVEVTRKILAKRLGRMTGGGIFAESQKFGLEVAWPESGVFGSDSVQNAVHRGKLFWLWGDTNVPGYPLGIYDSTGGFTAPQPIAKFEPPLRLQADYFKDGKGRVRGIAKMPGEGPTWVTGVASLPDKQGNYHLVGSFVKIKNMLDAYQSGLCVWNETTQNFDLLRTLWTKSATSGKYPPMPEGHANLWTEGTEGAQGTKKDGKTWVLFGNPLPNLRCAATFEAWQDPAQWEVLHPSNKLAIAGKAGATVELHSGSIAWNEYRHRWVTVFMEKFGKPSAFGELWYAESTTANPMGTWGAAVKILSHQNYTFYNPKIHAEFTKADSPILIFEGTYTQTFADKPFPTARYDYNQILYRLDLDDPGLSAAH